MCGVGDDGKTSPLPDRIVHVVCGVGDDGDTSPLPDRIVHVVCGVGDDGDTSRDKQSCHSRQFQTNLKKNGIYFL